MEPRQMSSASHTMTLADRQNLEMLREYYAHHGKEQVSSFCLQLTNQRVQGC